MINFSKDEGLDPTALRAAVMRQLLQHDIAEVIIEFDGSGDEGQIESIGATKLDGREVTLDFPADIPGAVISSVNLVWDSQARGYTTQENHSPTLADILDDWAYKLLEQVGIDWINNDGGYGEIVITPATDSIRCEMNKRFTDAETTEHEL